MDASRASILHSLVKGHPMSVLFDIVGHRWPMDEDGCCLPPASMFLNIANDNARDFLRWLGLPDSDLCGDMPARQLAALLRRRLWPERRNDSDLGRPSSIDRRPGKVTIIDCGREPGRLATYAERLLALAEFAGDRTIFWS
jgi:hypothetical protein